jgi:hypothetical protein
VHKYQDIQFRVVELALAVDWYHLRLVGRTGLDLDRVPAVNVSDDPTRFKALSFMARGAPLAQTHEAGRVAHYVMPYGRVDEQLAEKIKIGPT